jgi:large subunit ribosomal protein L34e
MAARVTYKRKHTYRTRSNQVRKLRTPGGKLTIQYTNKRNGLRVCGDTQVPLNGIPRSRNTEFRGLSKRSRTVSRPYGGSLSHEAVRHRIMRSFFNEELKVIKAGATASRKGKKKVGGKKK